MGLAGLGFSTVFSPIVNIRFSNIQIASACAGQIHPNSRTDGPQVRTREEISGDP